VPWHTGNIFDAIDAGDGGDFEYWEMEAEANRFASELLLPTEWVRAQGQLYSDPARALREISRRADVSGSSAAIKLIACLNPGYVYAETQDGVVVRAGASPRTSVTVPQRGVVDLSGYFPMAGSKSSVSIGYSDFYWWNLNVSETKIDNVPTESWRELLDIILSDIAIVGDVAAFRRSLNGVVAAANGGLAYNRNPNGIRNACAQRLHIRANEDARYAALISHPRFADFLTARAISFFER
jgi:hypothetical protein